MSAPSRKMYQTKELELGDFTQEIDAPLEDSVPTDEPTLTKLDFDDVDIDL